MDYEEDMEDIELYESFYGRKDSHKSDINLLQEISIKYGILPTYTFTEHYINSNKQFQCNVSYGELIAHGTGNNKKEAKRNAARDMLLLLPTIDNISLPVNTSSVNTSSINTSSLPVNTLPVNTSSRKILQNFAKVCEISPSNKHSVKIDHNYIGLLQEFCQQKKISPNNIQYKLIDDKGLDHQKTFTIEVSLTAFNSLLREEGTAQCKKSAKQEAAKNMLLHLNPDLIAKKNIASNPHEIVCQKEEDRKKLLPRMNPDLIAKKNIASNPHEIVCQKEEDRKKLLPRMNPDLIAKKNIASNPHEIVCQKEEDPKNMLPRMNPDLIAKKNIASNPHDIVCQTETLENIIRKLGTKILECNDNKDTLPVAKLSENAKSLYLKHKNINIIEQENSHLLKDVHILFKNNYSNIISDDMKNKMQIIRDKYPNPILIPYLMYKIRQDIESLLKVKIQEITIHTKSQNHMICLHLLSNPHITQLGIGETKIEAECHATYNLMGAILMFID